MRQALVTGEINTRAGFVADNLKVLEQAREEEAKLRRAGIVADEDWQARWYLDRIPADRWGEPSDLGGTAVFLASRASDYVNGAVIPVDGGWLAR